MIARTETASLEGIAPPPTLVRWLLHLQGICEVAVFGLLPCLLVLSALNETGFEPTDFQVFWKAGDHVLHGVSPYPQPTHAAVATEHAFVYPPPAALLFAPLGALPQAVALGLYVPLQIAALLLGLRLLGVRDWRCYGIAFLSIWTLNSFRTGALGPFLMLAIALAWRYRDRPWPAGVSVASLWVSKVFLWPLLAWLVATRRWAAVVRSVALGLAATFVSWAVLGFAGMADYPRLLRLLADALEAKSFSVVALGLALGLPKAAALAIAFAAGGMCLALVFVAARRRDGEALALTAAISASLLISPIGWPHYFVILFVPLALASPRLSPLWLIPLATWVAPNAQASGRLYVLIPALAVAALAAVSSGYVLSPRQRQASPATPQTA